MLIAAAVCPHPPLLIPEVTGPSGADDAELGRLRTACRQAVDALLAERPGLIAVVGGDPRTAQAAEYPPGTPGRLHDFGVPVTIGTGPGGLPLSLTIGKWLLKGRETAPSQWWGIGSAAPPDDCLQLGEKLAALAPRVGLLVMGDGPARRARAAPNAADPEADRYDDLLAGALAGPDGRADPAALAALDPRRDGPLEIAGRAAWQVLAGAAGQAPFAAELLFRGAPFEVSYVVASWRRAP
jgi:hypothetical protein